MVDVRDYRNIPNLNHQRLFNAAKVQKAQFSTHSAPTSMKELLVNTIWAVGGVAFALFCLSACTRELAVQQAYDFSLEVMPVQNSIAKRETAEIRCLLKTEG